MIVFPEGFSDPQHWLPSDMFQALQDFEDVIQQHCKVEIGRSASTTRAINHLLDLLSAFAREIQQDRSRDYRHASRVAVGLADMARKTAAIAAHKDFGALCPHLSLFLEESALVQNVKNPSGDAVSNKLFELVVAMSVMQFANDIALDDPMHSSGGKNPDVLAKIHGEWWGFACKVVHTPNLLTYKDNVQSAVNQIERSTAKHGLVVIGLRNVINQDLIWPTRVANDGAIEYAHWSSSEFVDALLEQLVVEVLNTWETAFGGDSGIDEVFSGKKAAPIVLNYVHETTTCQIDGKDMLTSLRRIIPLGFGRPVDRANLNMIERLSDAIQRP